MENKGKLKELKWWDILILTIIMFGEAIYTSTVIFFDSFSYGAIAMIESAEITYADNYYMLIKQGIILIIAVGYLMFRKFDFSQWKVKINLKTTLMGIGLFIVLALAMDLYVWGVGWVQNSAAGLPTSFEFGDYQGISIFAMFNLPTVMYAMLNGFYEEVYFLGMCLFVKPAKLKYAFLFSLFVRFAFHTYQGLIWAIGFVLVLGIPYYLIYMKTNRENLYPICLSHSIADVLGVGLLIYLL